MDFASRDSCGEDCADGSFHLTDIRLYIGYIIVLGPLCRRGREDHTGVVPATPLIQKSWFEFAGAGGVSFVWPGHQLPRLPVHQLLGCGCSSSEFIVASRMT